MKMKKRRIAVLSMLIFFGSGCELISSPTVEQSLVSPTGAGDDVSLDHEPLLTLLIDEGTVLAAYPLPELLPTGATRVTVEVASGSARFHDSGGAEGIVAYSHGGVMPPGLQAGRAYDESLIRLSLKGGEPLGMLRVRTLPMAGVRHLISTIGADSQALLRFEEHAALLDERRLRVEARGIRMSLTGEPTGQAQAADICIRSPFGPGWVNWNMYNPSGAGYSVKPEGSFSLSWASAPGQDADGIYNHWWRCGTALKIPDSCTATVGGGGHISCCCNAALAAAGYVCQWVNPGLIGWPGCPL